MGRTEMSDNAVGLLRLTAAVFGVVLVILAVFADRTGMSVGSGFSRNQIGFCAAGGFLIFAAILGRRFPGFYKGVALILLNAAVALVLLELFSIAFMKIAPPGILQTHLRKLREGHLETVEAAVVQGVYAPFVVWRSNPLLNSDTVTVSEEGYRVTPGASADPGAFKVFLFGGSAMWGVNLSDSNTIASFVQQKLTERLGVPVAVYNFGQIAHSSTQEVIELIIQIRSGNVPDAVVYFDGFNDIWGGYESGRAGGHHSQMQIAARVEGRPEAFTTTPPLQALFQRTNTYILISALRGNLDRRSSRVADLQTFRTMGVPAEVLASDIVDTYLGNSRIVTALAEQLDFTCLFVLQPSIWTGNKVLTESEQEIFEGGFEFFLAGGDPAFKELYTATYDLFELSVADSAQFLTFSGIFDGVSETVYSDYSGAHMTPAADEIVADSLVAELLNRIPAGRN